MVLPREMGAHGPGGGRGTAVQRMSPTDSRRRRRPSSAYSASRRFRVILVGRRTDVLPSVRFEVGERAAGSAMQTAAAAAAVTWTRD